MLEALGELHIDIFSDNWKVLWTFPLSVISGSRAALTSETLGVPDNTSNLTEGQVAVWHSQAGTPLLSTVPLSTSGQNKWVTVKVQSADKELLMEPGGWLWSCRSWSCAATFWSLSLELSWPSLHSLFSKHLSHHWLFFFSPSQFYSVSLYNKNKTLQNSDAVCRQC